MSIREATTDDVAAIIAVAEAAWAADYPDFLSRETAEAGVADWYDPARIQSELADPATRLLVAAVDDAVVGFAHAYVDGEVGHLLRLYVHPDERRAGLGRQLFEGARASIAELDVDRITGMVLADNEPGNAFYRSLGFEHEATAETTIGGESYPEHRYVYQVS